MGAPERHERAATVGRSVRDARRTLGLDQVTVAELAGVSERFLRALEHGKDTVQLRQLLSVCEVLGLELQLVASSVQLATAPTEGGDDR
jgi:HTH-type transcriptional regulator / antitoxin HipB